MSAQDAQVIQWIEANWIWVLIVFWIVVGGAGESLRRALRERRQHQIDLALARRGIDPAARKVQVVDDDDDEDDEDEDENWTGIRIRIGGRQTRATRYDEDDELALPAAVTATPPSARPVRGVPGACRHERIVPVIDGTGELQRWVCANWPRCDAKFDKSVAIYAPDDDQEGPQ